MSRDADEGTVEGEGWDHVARRIERPDGTWIVKQVKDGPWVDAVTSVAREAAVMRALRETLPAPFDDWVPADASAAGDRLTYRRVPGEPLIELLAAQRVPGAVRDRLAAELGRLIDAIAAVDPATIGLAVPVEDQGWSAWFEGLDDQLAVVAPLLDADVRAAVDRFAATAPPPELGPEHLVLTHNDLGAEHVLIDPTSLTITGVIDWTDTALADAAADVGRLWRDLGPHAMPIVLDGLGLLGGAVGLERDSIVARARCYARLLAVEDLAYAITHRPHLVPAEAAAVAQLFAPAVG